MPASDQTTRPRALITGASSGIGLAFARRIARDGHDLILVARGKERLDTVARELEKSGAACEVIGADLTTAEGLRAVERRTAAGNLAMLVNNVGFQTYKPLVELDPGRAEEQIFAHCTVTARLTRAALPAMLARKSGAIINVSSMLAFSAAIDKSFLPKRAVYVGTKAFINAFTEMLATEIAGSGVKLQALCPAVVRTEFHNIEGKPVLRPSTAPIMEPETVVDASLAALTLGDIVCSPGLTNYALVERERSARNALFGAGLGANLSPRYGGNPAS